VQPRDVPLAPRARIVDVIARRARIVGARTAVARDDLGLAPGVVSPYEAREAMGLRYGDPAIEEARYDRTRTRTSDAALLARWMVARLVRRSGRGGGAETRPYVVSTRVDALDTGDAIAKILGWLVAGRGGRVFFVHPHALNLASRDDGFRAELARGDLVLPDGIGLRVASSILGIALPANVNGTDLVPELLLELSADRVPIALVGGAPGVAAKAAAAWSRTGVPVLGTWDGFSDEATYQAMTAKIRTAGRCVVMVAMGSPHQERFALRHLEDLPQAVSITVGGLFDFASGDKRRAPLAWRELGLEWAWRLIHEPRRLGRRYLVGNPEFLLRAVAQRLRSRASVPAA
jgi:N-acetylglucosaminyldiphosphoundecaprenol N-acetyl-beta-D-mannosaminyltransferase